MFDDLSYKCSLGKTVIEFRVPRLGKRRFARRRQISKLIRETARTRTDSPRRFHPVVETVVRLYGRDVRLKMLLDPVAGSLPTPGRPRGTRDRVNRLVTSRNASSKRSIRSSFEIVVSSTTVLFSKFRVNAESSPPYYKIRKKNVSNDTRGQNCNRNCPRDVEDSRYLVSCTTRR